jgi:sporulation protein YabP
MLENNNNCLKNHELNLKSREKMSLSGIKEIISFDESEISLKTCCGDLTIDGENIHINVLNVSIGELELVGKINGIYYSDISNNEKHSILGKIFH